MSEMQRYTNVQMYVLLILQRPCNPNSCRSHTDARQMLKLAHAAVAGYSYAWPHTNAIGTNYVLRLTYAYHRSMAAHGLTSSRYVQHVFRKRIGLKCDVK